MNLEDLEKELEGLTYSFDGRQRMREIIKKYKESVIQREEEEKLDAWGDSFDRDRFS